MYLVDDAWNVVKEYMLDWRVGWNKRFSSTLESIKQRLPTTLVGERYDMETRLYSTTFRRNNNGLELRVSSSYCATENRWTLQ